MSSSSSSSGCFHVYNTPGTYEWTCPEGVFAVDVVCVGGGSSGYFGDDSGPQLGRGGGGGGKVNAKLAVTPGQPYTFTVGAGGAAVTSPGCNDGEDSSFSGDIGSAIGRGGNQHNGGGIVVANVGDAIIDGNNGSISTGGNGGGGGDSARGSGGAGATFSSVAVFGGSAGGGGGGGATTFGGNTPTATQRYGAVGGPGMVSISCNV